MTLKVKKETKTMEVRYSDVPVSLYNNLKIHALKREVKPIQIFLEWLSELPK